MCLTKELDAAAHLYSEPLSARPALADDRPAPHHYDAACAATMVGRGEGKDDPPPGGEARGRLRAQTLGWLRTELPAWKKVAAAAGPGDRPTVVKAHAHWKDDADLAGVRDAPGDGEAPRG